MGVSAHQYVPWSDVAENPASVRAILWRYVRLWLYRVLVLLLGAQIHEQCYPDQNFYPCGTGIWGYPLNDDVRKILSAHYIKC